MLGQEGGVGQSKSKRIAQRLPRQDLQKREHMDFDWGQIGKIFSYLIPVIMFILFNVLFKKQREQQRRMAVVKSLLSETEHGSKLVDSLSFQSQVKNFRTATWKKNRDKIDYVEPNLIVFRFRCCCTRIASYKL